MKAATQITLVQRPSLALTPDLRLAIGLLGLPARELLRYAEKEAEKNPYLSIRMPPGAPDMPATSGQIVETVGLISHVTAQLGLCHIEPDEMPVAQALIGALDPSGWLATPLTRIAAQSGRPVAACEAVLRRLQQMEPTGLFARSLAECLGLQLAEKGQLDDAAARLLANLPLLETGGPGELAAAAGLSEAQIEVVLARLRGCNPKPGAGFAHEAAAPVLPDVILRRRKAGWRAEINPAAHPDLQVDAGARPGPPDRRALGTARWIVRAMAHRQDTLLRIAQTCADCQRDMLERGPSARQPLLQKTVAKRLDLSESTVSRIAGAAFAQTPSRVVAFSEFFARPLGEIAITGPRAARAIAKMIAAEDRSAPLSDRQIAAQLATLGLPLARRTVAKYRRQSGLPGAAERRGKRLDSATPADGPTKA